MVRAQAGKYPVVQLLFPHSMQLDKARATAGAAHLSSLLVSSLHLLKPAISLSIALTCSDANGQ